MTEQLPTHCWTFAFALSDGALSTICWLTRHAVAYDMTRSPGHPVERTHPCYIARCGVCRTTLGGAGVTTRHFTTPRGAIAAAALCGWGSVNGQLRCPACTTAPRTAARSGHDD
jgi:hypothetical protein